MNRVVLRHAALALSVGAGLLGHLGCTPGTIGPGSDGGLRDGLHDGAAGDLDAASEGDGELAADSGGPLSEALRITAKLPPMRIGARKELIFDGRDLALIWEGIHTDSDERQLMFAKISTAGELLVPPKPIAALGDNTQLSLFREQGEYLLWSWDWAGKKKVEVRRLSDAGDLQPEVKVLGASNLNIAVARNDALYAVASGQTVSRVVDGATIDSTHVFLQFFDRQLAPQRPAVELHPAGTSWQFRPALDWIGAPSAGADRVLVAWDEAGRTVQYAVRAADGAEVAAPRALLDDSERQCSARVTGLGAGRALVSWGIFGEASRAPHFVVFDPAEPGTVVAREFFEDNRAESFDFHMALLGSRALFAWETRTAEGPPLTQVAVMPVELPAQGPPEPGQQQLISDPRFSAKEPRVAATGEGFAVLFSALVEQRFDLYLRLLPRDTP